MPNRMEIVAPVPGLVASVAVSPGMAVKRGDPVAVLQSMKMEIPVPAEVDGTIVEVLVEAGQEIDIGGVIAYLTTEQTR